MKPFNLEEYLANPSKKVITRDGRNVTIHCTNFNSCQPIIAQIEGHNFSNSFTRDGKYCIDDKNLPYDLFFASEKHEGWVNVYKSGFGWSLGVSIWQTEEEAKKWIGAADYATTIKIEWEE